MKKIIILFSIIFFTNGIKSFGQSKEAQQLLLNVEKLAQFKQILSDMKKGYQIVSTGYNTIKNISQGNFNLHKTFLDGLFEVSPAVRKYKKVGDIINMQLVLISECKNAFKRFNKNDLFSIEEIDYLNKVYKNLFDESLKNLDEMVTVLTAGKLRMSDDERLNSIDRIFFKMQDELLFLKNFNTNNSILAIQRSKEQNDVNEARKLYGVK